MRGNISPQLIFPSSRIWIRFTTFFTSFPNKTKRRSTVLGRFRSNLIDHAHMSHMFFAWHNEEQLLRRCEKRGKVVPNPSTRNSWDFHTFWIHNIWSCRFFSSGQRRHTRGTGTHSGVKGDDLIQKNVWPISSWFHNFSSNSRLSFEALRSINVQIKY